MANLINAEMYSKVLDDTVNYDMYQDLQCTWVLLHNIHIMTTTPIKIASFLTIFVIIFDTISLIIITQSNSL